MHSTALPTLIPVGHATIDPVRRRRPIGVVLARLGFPSPAEDFQDESLDLNSLIVTNEPATFFYRARGTSMEGLGIFDGDILAVDRSLNTCDGDLVVAIWDGNAPVCKTVRFFGNAVELHSAAEDVPVIRLSGDMTLEAFVVTGVVRQVKRGGRPHVRTG